MKACVCDPRDWLKSPIPPACGLYVEDHDFDGTCTGCHHEEGCHDAVFSMEKAAADLKARHCAGELAAETWFVKNDASCVNNVCREVDGKREMILRSTTYYDIVSDSEEFQKQNARAELAAMAPELYRELAEAMALLRELEWEGDDARILCPRCHYKSSLHAADCKLDAYLKKHPEGGE